MQEASIEQLISKHLDKVLPKKLQEIEANKTPSMAIIATKGTLDWAYPPFILASTGSALGWNVSIFFTFYGLLLLKKDLGAEVSPLGNPAMPMKMPFGPKWFQNFVWPMPNLIMAGIPGFEKMATMLMKKTFSKKGVASDTPDSARAARQRPGLWEMSTRNPRNRSRTRVSEIFPGTDSAVSTFTVNPPR